MVRLWSCSTVEASSASCCGDLAVRVASPWDVGIRTVWCGHSSAEPSDCGEQNCPWLPVGLTVVDD